MGFWIFMLISDLLIPVVLICFGRYFMSKAPASINLVFGYRTAMSMKNKETWEHAHKFCGKIWFVSGLVLVPVTVLTALVSMGRDKDFVGGLGAAICYVQLALLVLSIVCTERELKRTFDKEGKRILPSEDCSSGVRQSRKSE